MKIRRLTLPPYSGQTSFVFSENNKTVEDIYSKVNKIIFTVDGGVSTEIRNRKRIILVDGGAILKTSNDSIDVEKSYTKLKGYMGIWDEEHKHFYVDTDGSFLIKIDQKAKSH